LMGGDSGVVLNQAPPRVAPGPQQAAQDDEAKKFVSVILADTDNVWGQLFHDQFGCEYRQPKMVLFSDRVQSGCGIAGSQSGPFYCPGDQNVSLD